MVPQCGVNGQVGEVLSDGLGHVSDHLDDRVCGELTWRDVRGAVTRREAKHPQNARFNHTLDYFSSILFKQMLKSSPSTQTCSLKLLH